MSTHCSPSTSPAEPPARRLGAQPALDGVRGFAIAVVMLFHAYAARFPGGYIGVDVFFVLSAFLITTQIVERYADSGRFDAVDFYGRRALRLGPALVLFLLTLAPITVAVTHQAGRIALSTVGTLFYANDFVYAYAPATLSTAYTHTWSLAIEEQFYLVWPAVLVCALTRLRPAASRWLLWLALAAACVIQVGHPAQHLPWGHFVAIGAGIVIADAFRRHGLGRLAGVQLVGAMAVLVLVAEVLAADHLSETDQDRWMTAVAGIAAAVWVGHVLRAPSGALGRFSSLAPLRWLGQRSYGLYLYHRTLAILVPALWTGVKLRTAGPLVIVLACVMAEASYRFVERPIRDRGRRRLAKRAVARGSAQPVPA